MYYMHSDACLDIQSHNTRKIPSSQDHVVEDLYPTTDLFVDVVQMNSPILFPKSPRNVYHEQISE